MKIRRQLVESKEFELTPEITEFWYSINSILDFANDTAKILKEWNNQGYMVEKEAGYIRQDLQDIKDMLNRAYEYAGFLQGE